MKRLWLLMFLAGTVALAVQAQTYVRPGNASPITLVTGWGLSSGNTFVSASLATAGFEGIQIIEVLSSAPGNCSYYPSTVITGGVTSGASLAVNDDHATFAWSLGTNTSATYVVANVPPFVTFTMTPTAGAGGTGCTLSIYVVPLALDRKATTVQQTRPLSAPAAAVSVGTSAVLVLTTTDSQPGFNIQNVGAYTVFCGAGSSTTDTVYNTVIAPDAVGNSGGSFPYGNGTMWTETDRVPGTAIYCVTASGTGAVSVTLK